MKGTLLLARNCVSSSTTTTTTAPTSSQARLPSHSVRVCTRTRKHTHKHTQTVLCHMETNRPVIHIPAHTCTHFTRVYVLYSYIFMLKLSIPLLTHYLVHCTKFKKYTQQRPWILSQTLHILH